MAFHCIRCRKEIDKSFRACPHCGEPVTDFLRRYLEEPIDGKYRILERLGMGGMGEVYKVEHTYLGATRVVKIIRPQISESRDAHDRFLREARLATKVQHPNVATLHDFSALPDGAHYMVWEYIDGENVAQRLRARGVLPPRTAVRIAIDALRGLEAIHRAGIVHRDISPENVMITRDTDAVKIIDLGVAKTEEPSDNATRAGVFVGKLRYASPEHLGFLNEGERIDGRADLYSLAMVLFEMLTGRPPFEATSPHEYLLMHSRDTQFRTFELPPSLPGGAELQAVLQRALERDRTRRYPNAGEFAAALEPIERKLPDPAGDETMRLTPPPDPLLRQTTVRTAAPPPPTIRTPLPSAPPPRASRGPLFAIAALALLVLGLGAVVATLLLREKPEREPVPEPRISEPIVQTTSAAPAPSQTTMEVVTETAPPTTTTVAPAIPAPVTTTTRVEETRPAPVPVPVPQPQPVPVPVPQPQPQPAPAPPPASSVPAYVEGEGDDALIERLREAMAGVTSVAIRGSGADALAATFREEFSTLTIADDASVVIHFDATLERLGRGRKRRAADATVTKNGRVVFRYQMKPQEYRVGDTPAEAFTRVFSDVIE